MLLVRLYRNFRWEAIEGIARQMSVNSGYRLFMAIQNYCLLSSLFHAGLDPVQDEIHVDPVHRRTRKRGLVIGFSLMFLVFDGQLLQARHQFVGGTMQRCPAQAQKALMMP